MHSRSNGLRPLRMFAAFIGIVLLTVIVFFALAIIISPEGDEGMLMVIGITISLQLSFLTAYILCKSKT